MTIQRVQKCFSKNSKWPETKNGISQDYSVSPTSQVRNPQEVKAVRQSISWMRAPYPHKREPMCPAPLLTDSCMG